MGQCTVPDKPPAYLSPPPRCDGSLTILCAVCSVAQCVGLLRPHRPWPARLLCPWDFLCVYVCFHSTNIYSTLYMLVNGHWPIRPAPKLPGTHNSERYRLVNGINTCSDKFSDGILGVLNPDWRISAQTPWRNLPQDLQICLDILNISVNLPSFIVHHFILNLLKFLTRPFYPQYE